jgi:hypothetical protein
MAASRWYSDGVKYILELPYCSSELLLQQTKKGATSLILASHSQPKAVKYILDSPYCTEEFMLKHTKNTGETCLIAASDSKVVKDILDSQYCTSKLLLYQVEYDYTKLKRESKLQQHKVKCILESRLLTKDILIRIIINSYNIKDYKILKDALNSKLFHIDLLLQSVDPVLTNYVTKIYNSLNNINDIETMFPKLSPYNPSTNRYLSDAESCAMSSASMKYKKC